MIINFKHNIQEISMIINCKYDVNVLKQNILEINMINILEIILTVNQYKQFTYQQTTNMLHIMTPKCAMGIPILILQRR